MSIFDRYFNSLKKEQQKELQRILNSNVFDIKLADVKDPNFSEQDYTKEEADELILADYDKKSFLSELKRSVKPQAIENMNERLDGKTKEQIEEERRETIKRKAKNLEDPEQLITELEEEENKDKTSDVKDSFAIRSEAIKSVYMTVAREYYRLVSDLQTGQNGQIYTGSIVNTTKIDNKLVMYQSYLRKLDLWYRNINHGMPLGFDDDVKELISSEEYKKNKNDAITNSVRDKQVDRIEDIQTKLDAIEEEMVTISKLNDNSVESTQRLAELKKEYLDKKMELSALKPSIGVLHAEYQEKERIEELAEKKGINQNDKYKARTLGTKNNELDEKNEFNEERIEKDTENVIHDKLIGENISQAEEALERFDKQFESGEYNDAIQSLMVAKSLMATASSTIGEIDNDNEIFEKAKSESERLRSEKLKKEREDKMGIGAICTEEEIISKDIEESLKGIRNKVKDDIEKAKSSNERCL